MSRAVSKTVKKDEKNGMMDKAPGYIKKQDVDVPDVEMGLSFPVLKLLQQVSPELDEDDVKFVKRASAGMIMITDGTTIKLFDGEKGVRFCPLIVRKVYTEWVPRAKGGGFVASYSSKEEADANFTPGNELNVSIDYLVISPDVMDNGLMYPFIISFNSPTKMAAARELQKYILSYRTMHGVTYRLKSKKQANKAGQKFHGFVLSTEAWTDEKLYKELEKVKKEKEILFLPISDETPF